MIRKGININIIHFMLCLLLLASCNNKTEKNLELRKVNEVAVDGIISDKLEEQTSKQLDVNCFLKKFDTLGYSVEVSYFKDIREVDHFLIDILFEDNTDLYWKGIEQISGFLVSKAKNKKLPQVYVANILFEDKNQAKNWFFHIINSERAYRILKQKSYYHMLFAEQNIILCRGFGNNQKEKELFADEIVNLVEDCVSCTGIEGMKMSEDTNTGLQLRGQNL